MKKLLLGALIAMTVLVMSVGTVFAQDTTTSYTGTVQNVTIETDTTTGATTVVVTYSYVDDTGATQEQTVRLDPTTAQGLGLVEITTTTDPATGETITTVEKIDGAIGTEITIDPATVDPTTEEAQHPVASALDTFFSDLFDFEVGYDTIMALHEEGVVLEDGTTGGFGFGVIAQALWMTRHLEGDMDTVNAILQAKVDGNYDELLNGLTDGNGNPIEASNWGQFKKAVMNLNDDEDKKNAKENLGGVMSDKDRKNSDDQTGGETGDQVDPQIADDDGSGKGKSDNASSNKDNTNSKKDKGKSNKGRGHNK